MRLALVVTLLAPLAFGQHVTNAKPLDPADPRAQRATALVTLLGAGNFHGTLEVTNVLEGNDPGEVIVLLSSGGRGGRVAIIVDLETAPPHRIRSVRSMTSTRGDAMIGTHAKPIESGSQGEVLRADADHYAVRRAAQLVKALNDPKEGAAFIAEAWDLATTEQTAEAATKNLESLRERTGEGVVLREVELAGGGEVLARLVNQHDRGTTLRLAIAPAPPHRMYVTGVMRELQEVSPADATPKNVVLATPVVIAPITFEDGRPFTEVWIAGKGPYRFMVETGANRIVITPRVIAELGDRVQPASKDTMYRIGDAKISSMYDVDELRVGGARFLGMRVSVTPKQPGVDGVLGLPVFADVLLTVDYPKQQLRIEHGALPDANDEDIFPTRRFGPFVGVDVTVGERVIPFILDTQASSSGALLTLTPELQSRVQFETAPVELGRALVGQVHESVVTIARHAGNAKLGRYTFARPLVSVMSFGMQHDAGSLGADWLRHFAVTLDQKNQRVRFAAKDTTFAAPPPMRTFGLTAKREGDQLTVTTVRDGGPAARAGVQIGDVVVRFGGTNAQSLPRSLNSLAVDAKPVKLELLRDGKRLMVPLKSEVLVP